jgi:hypothetical protein
MRTYAAALLVYLAAAAPVVIFWDRLAPSEKQPARPGQPAKPRAAVSQVHAQVRALDREYEDAMRASATRPPDRNATSAAATPRPGELFFQRFLALAEAHPHDPLCPHLVGRALAVKGAAPLKPGDHLRINALLAGHPQRCVIVGEDW